MKAVRLPNGDLVLRLEPSEQGYVMEALLNQIKRDERHLFKQLLDALAPPGH